jgi:hypothetical protein
MPSRLHFSCRTVSNLTHELYDRIVLAVAELPLPTWKLEDAAVNVAVSEIAEVEVLLERRLE